MTWGARPRPFPCPPTPPPPAPRASPSRCHPTGSSASRRRRSAARAASRAARSSRRRSSGADSPSPPVPWRRPGRRPASCRGEPSRCSSCASRSSRACGSTSAPGSPSRRSSSSCRCCSCCRAQLVPLAGAAAGFVLAATFPTWPRGALHGRAARHAPRRLMVRARPGVRAHAARRRRRPTSGDWPLLHRRARARSSPSTSSSAAVRAELRARRAARATAARVALGLRPSTRCSRRSACSPRSPPRDRRHASLLVLPLAALLSLFARERRDAPRAGASSSASAYRGTALRARRRDRGADDATPARPHAAASSRSPLEVADELGLDATSASNVEFGALLHDIGKIAIPDAIINKPGPLDDDEWALIRPTRSRASGCSTASAGCCARSA